MDVDNNTSNGTLCDLYYHHNTARILLPIFYSMIFLFGLLGNILAMFVIHKNRRKLNSTTLYSRNLVISDICFAIVSPSRIVYYAKGFDWTFGEAFCRITALFLYINTYAGVNFMTCLSIDRFFAVVHPHRYNRIRRVKFAKIICICVWLLVFFQTFPLLIQQMSQTELHTGKTRCMEYPIFEAIDNLPYILLGACFIGFYLPLVIILYCYSQISIKLCQTTKKNPLSEKTGTNKKATNTIILVIVVFLICFTPYHAAITQHMIKKLIYQPDCEEQKLFQVVLHVTVCLMNLNCCLDPLIYFCACKGYKNQILKILKRQASVTSSSATRPAAEESSRDLTESQMNQSIPLNHKVNQSVSKK
ncbi:G-protein coupled receptor 183 [Bufo bufo]|uniref:G-protein coupled receptor 183 n=1 Tax=Bufo bufo TaxID=8384 RepID=UPI001ABE8A55|nr:G-protein coupled receptor 183 [Bufo bufo]XP_040281202.1 G-protein coupled receptor 183 [Bufo bufo]XP_040281203.1 G-protein coupled receptor 183 [Bufo bufo]